jgi:kynurenine formamidase
MHCTTHTDAPAHVIEGLAFTDEVPLHMYFGPGVVLSVPKEEDWEPITREDLEKATPKIEPGDLVIINCGWHRYYSDSRKYFAYSPGLVPSAIEYLLEVGVKGVGVDQQALDHRWRRPSSSAAPDAPASVVKGARRGRSSIRWISPTRSLPSPDLQQRAIGFENVYGGHRQGQRQARRHRRLPGAGRRATAASCAWSPS